MYFPFLLFPFLFYFSQPEVVMPITVASPKLFHLVLHYVSLGSKSSKGKISVAEGKHIGSNYTCKWINFLTRLPCLPLSYTIIAIPVYTFLHVPFSCRTLVWCLHGFWLFLNSALYGCFCLLTSIFQNEVRITLNVEKSNLYFFRIILRYINPGGETLSGRISACQSQPGAGRCNSAVQQLRWMLDQRRLSKVHLSQVFNVA